MQVLNSLMLAAALAATLLCAYRIAALQEDPDPDSHSSLGFGAGSMAAVGAGSGGDAPAAGTGETLPCWLWSLMAADGVLAAVAAAVGIAAVAMRR